MIKFIVDLYYHILKFLKLITSKYLLSSFLLYIFSSHQWMMINKLFHPSNIKDHLKYNLNNSLALYLYLTTNYINLSMIHVLFYSRQRLLFLKLVNLITKPNLKSKNLYLNRPYYYWMKHKKFYNMQRVVAKILIAILLYVYYIIYLVLIEIYGLCPNAPPIFKVF